jgi:hypothetical protein
VAGVYARASVRRDSMDDQTMQRKIDSVVSSTYPKHRCNAVKRLVLFSLKTFSPPCRRRMGAMISAVSTLDLVCNALQRYLDLYKTRTPL